MRTPKIRYVVQAWGGGMWWDAQYFTKEKDAFHALKVCRLTCPKILYRLVKFEMVKVYSL